MEICKLQITGEATVFNEGFRKALWKMLIYLAAEGNSRLREPLKLYLAGLRFTNDVEKAFEGSGFPELALAVKAKRLPLSFRLKILANNKDYPPTSPYFTVEVYGTTSLIEAINDSFIPCTFKASDKPLQYGEFLACSEPVSFCVSQTVEATFDNVFFTNTEPHLLSVISRISRELILLESHALKYKITCIPEKARINEAKGVLVKEIGLELRGKTAWFWLCSGIGSATDLGMGSVKEFRKAQALLIA